MAQSPNVIELTDQNFSKTVLESQGIVIVDFWAEWCRPCLMLGPTIDALADEYAGKVKVCKMNIDQHEHTPVKFGIKSIPTILFFKNGKQVDSLVGVSPKESFVGVIQKLASS
jgi:thioredoxin 1